MTKRKPMGHDLDNLPLFAADHDIGIALLGPDRACEWPSLVPLYERQGFPKIDAIMGARYWPAVRAFFDQQYGLAAIPVKPNREWEELERRFSAMTEKRRLFWESIDPKTFFEPQHIERGPVPPFETPIDTIYFIGCDGHVKIGVTSDINKRLHTLATGHHRELTLLATVQSPGALEFELHQRFAQYRVRGEWFTLSPEIQEYIDQIKAGNQSK